VALADLLVEKSAPYPGSAGSLFDAHSERRRVGTHIDAPASVSMPEYAAESWSAPGAIKEKPRVH
jgi:hypothetical protein